MKHDDTEHSLRDECDGRCPHQYLSCSKESFSFDMVLDFYRNGTQLGNSFSELICIDFYVWSYVAKDNRISKQNPRD